MKTSCYCFNSISVGRSFKCFNCLSSITKCHSFQVALHRRPLTSGPLALCKPAATVSRNTEKPSCRVWLTNLLLSRSASQAPAQSVGSLGSWPQPASFTLPTLGKQPRQADKFQNTIAVTLHVCLP